ncbi:MAG: DUF1573 domain-containing protein [Flavobacteriales bacterium]
MKDTIKIALLAVIAGTLIIQTLSDRGGDQAKPSSSVAAAPAAATPATVADKKTFDPLTPPTPGANLPPPTGPTTNIAFPVMEHNFGKVMQNSENTYVFKFTNSGSEPLVISNAQGSCGCTVPEYPKEPIAPGKSSEIKVVYKPGMQQGSQAKTVTVTANTNPPQTILRINADVQVDPNAQPGAAGH